MKTKKKILSLLLTAALCFCLLPGRAGPALAASNASTCIFDITEGSITIDNGTNAGAIKVSYGSSLSLDNIDRARAITITGGGTQTANTVTVKGSKAEDVNITLNGVNINNGSACAFSIGSDSAVNLTLYQT